MSPSKTGSSIPKSPASSPKGVSGKPLFKETWTKDLGKIHLAAFPANAPLAAVLTVDGNLTTFDPNGKTLYSVNIGLGIRSISVAGTSEVFAVQDNGTSFLVNPSGDILWRKKLIPAVCGYITSSGRHLVFITRIPEIIFADRSCKQMWVYRNLSQPPTALVSAGRKETIGFSSTNDLGNGFVSTDESGIFHPIMGLNSILDLAISENGEMVVALGREKQLYCFDIAKGKGLWRQPLKQDFHGLSFAEDCHHTLLYSKSGHLHLYDREGFPLAEQDLELPISEAAIRPDGKSLWSISLETGVIRFFHAQGQEAPQRAFRNLNEARFTELEPSPALETLPFLFRRSWNVELPKAGREDSPRVIPWLHGGRQFHLFLWNGFDSLLCYNDQGEEIWTLCYRGEQCRDLTLTVQGDLSLATFRQGIIGVKLDGIEHFRIPGSFRAAHCFGSGAFLVLRETDQVDHYAGNGRLPQTIQAGERLIGLKGTEKTAFLIAGSTIQAFDSNGVTGTFSCPGKPTFFEPLSESGDFLVGFDNGEISLLNDRAEMIFHHAMEGSILMACLNSERNVLCVATPEEEKIRLFRYADQCQVTVSLKGNITAMTLFQHGFLLANHLDEMIFMNRDGQILARQSFPDRIQKMFPANDQKSVFVLAENSLTRMSLLDNPANAHE